MTRILLAVCSALLLACNGGEPTNPSPPPPPSQTYGLFGFVETGSGVPIPGAKVELFRLAATLALSATQTNQSGFFAFPNVQGVFRLRVSKLGFALRTVDPIVSGAQRMHIALAQTFFADTLIAGDWVQTTVPATAPPCDPSGWDANAPCVRFLFEAGGSGTLKIAVAWVGSPELDILLLSETGALIAYSDPDGAERAVLNGQVVSGQQYEIRINSYYGAQTFQIKAELVP